MTRLNPVVRSAGMRGRMRHERRLEQLQPSWFGCFVGAWGDISVSFIAARSTPMGWEEGDFIMHIYSNMRVQVYLFSIPEAVIRRFTNWKLN